MPHIIVEYSSNLEDTVNIPEMLASMHNALANEGVEKGRIKTRGHSLPHSVVGDNQPNAGQMVHITLLLLEGRDVETKNQYGDAIHEICKEAVQKAFPNCAVTLEVRDMVADTYIL